MTYDEAAQKAKTNNYESFAELNTVADIIAAQAETWAAGTYSSAVRQKIQEAVQYLFTIQQYTNQSRVNPPTMAPTNEAAALTEMINASTAATNQARSCWVRAQNACRTFQAKA